MMIQVVFNTTEGKQAIADSSTINEPHCATACFAPPQSQGRWQFVMLEFGNNMSVYTLQDLHADLH